MGKLTTRKHVSFTDVVRPSHLKEDQSSDPSKSTQTRRAPDPDGTGDDMRVRGLPWTEYPGRGIDKTTYFIK